MDFYPRWCLDGIDDDQVLDILVALSSDAFDRAQDTRIDGCRHHNSDERLIGRADAFDPMGLILAAVNRPMLVMPKSRSRIFGFCASRTSESSRPLQMAPSQCPQRFPSHRHFSKAAVCILCGADS